MNRGLWILVGLVLLATTTVSWASYYDPEGGWWWNPAESGRGFNLEIQGNTLGIAMFVYNTSGDPEWYTGTGTIADNQFSATLQRFSGGQCIGCSYTPPSVDGNSGPVSITFTSDTTATMSLGENIFHSTL